MLKYTTMYFYYFSDQLRTYQQYYLKIYNNDIQIKEINYYCKKKFKLSKYVLLHKR